EICEDLWVAIPPSTVQALNGATICCNLSASDEVIGKAEYRRQIVSTQSAKNLCAYVYSDACYGESTTDLVFAGHNIIAENGKILNQTELFSGKDAIAEVDVEFLEHERSRFFKYSFNVPKCDEVEFDLKTSNFAPERKYDKTPFVPTDKERLAERAEFILTMQSNGLKRRLEHTHCKHAVIGISGGLDSALALLVTVRACKLLGKDPKDILAVTMPCFGTTTRTKNNAIKLTELLGVTLKEVDIKESVLKHFLDIGQDESVTDVTYENCQARERTQVLFDIANKNGGIVIGTGDLSELALGWATYNGDHMSSYAVNVSIPKTLVRHLVAYEAQKYGKEIGNVLTDILLTPVSPELIPAENDKIKQKTEDLVGPYILHDFFLYYFLRAGFSPKKIFEIALDTFKDEFDAKTILKWLEIFIKRFFSQQFKRSCIPDGVKVGTVTLSPRGDWRMPSDANATVWLDSLAELKNRYGC
ncbi:MAG TPA: NAD(+) synthase, partial [Clostridiales bacterium]|nr:NAD(+) synthase [Clostridiales bacterium]